jgi:transcriptional regulator with XRE-family HTH domain
MAKEQIMIESVADYGPAIRKLREKRKWSQERLAEELGVTQRLVSRWEIGPNLVSQKNFLRCINAMKGTLLVSFEVEQAD